jgi:hypothetical protein
VSPFCKPFLVSLSRADDLQWRTFNALESLLAIRARLASSLTCEKQELEVPDGRSGTSILPIKSIYLGGTKRDVNALKRFSKNGPITAVFATSKQKLRVAI